MGTEKKKLNHYRLKSKFQKLFKNLADGKKFTAHDAFKDYSSNVPPRKGFTNMDEIHQADREEAIVERLVESEFVERVPLE
jgi:glutamate mutase epsilon subunit